jgi:hypothetical protein
MVSRDRLAGDFNSLADVHHAFAGLDAEVATHDHSIPDGLDTTRSSHAEVVSDGAAAVDNGTDSSFQMEVVSDLASTQDVDTATSVDPEVVADFAASVKDGKGGATQAQVVSDVEFVEEVGNARPVEIHVSNTAQAAVENEDPVPLRVEVTTDVELGEAKTDFGQVHVSIDGPAQQSDHPSRRPLDVEIPSDVELLDRDDAACRDLEVAVALREIAAEGHDAAAVEIDVTEIILTLVHGFFPCF